MYNLTNELYNNENNDMKSVKNNQGRLSMSSYSLQSPLKKDNFELTNCDDPRCGICRFVRGYSPNLDYAKHTKKLERIGLILMEWLNNVEGNLT